MQVFLDIPWPDFFLCILFLAFLGGVAGFLAGLLGVGGGIVLVPGLYYIFLSLREQLDFSAEGLMHVAVGTSLAVIVPTGLSSMRAHRKRGAVDAGLVAKLGGGVVLGVIAATVIAGDLSGQALKMIFSGVILTLAGIMALDPARFRLRDSLPPQPWTGMAGSVIGAVSTLAGIGGATLSVPFMSLHGVSLHRAVGTASALGLVISIPAAIGFVVIGWGVGSLPPFSLGYVNALAWICIVPVSVLVAPLGAHVAHRASIAALRKIFALFMVLVALNIWRQIIWG